MALQCTVLFDSFDFPLILQDCLDKLFFFLPSNFHVVPGLSLKRWNTEIP